MSDANPWATPGGMNTPWSRSPSRSSARVAPSVGEPDPQVVEHDPGRAPQHVPVVGLVEVVVQADHGTGLLLGAVPLDHLAPQREPRPAVGLDEPAALVAVGVGLDDDHVGDDVRRSDPGHRREANRASAPVDDRVGAVSPGPTARSGRSHPGSRRGAGPGSRPCPARCPGRARGRRRRGRARTSHSTQARAPSSTGAPLAAGRHPTPVNLSPPETAKSRLSASWSSARMLTQNGPGRGDAGPARGVLARRQRHQRRVERQRREGLAGEADGLGVLHGGDDGDTGGEMAQDLAEAAGVERSPPRPPEIVAFGVDGLDPTACRLAHRVPSSSRPSSSSASSRRARPRPVRGGRGRSSILPWRRARRRDGGRRRWPEPRRAAGRCRRRCAGGRGGTAPTGGRPASAATCTA